MPYQPTGQAVNPDDSSVDPGLAVAVPEAQDGPECRHAGGLVVCRCGILRQCDHPSAAVREGERERLAAADAWLPGMLATIWWAVDDGPIGVNHAMRRDSDWVACGDVAVPDEYVIEAERIVLPDPSPFPPSLAAPEGTEQ